MSLLATPQVAYIMSNQVRPMIRTVAIGSAALSSGGDADTDANTQRWLKIQRKLSDWQQCPDSAADNEYAPPTDCSIEAAACIADALAQDDIDAPDQIVPMGDGGVAFERFEGDVYEVIEIGPDGSGEWKLFENCKLQARQSFPCVAQTE